MENYKQNYEIRPATQEDTKTLARMKIDLQEHLKSNNKIVWTLSEEKKKNLEDFYKVYIKDENTKLLIVIDKNSGKPAGMGHGKIFITDEYIQRETGYIEDVWIEPEHRRKGLCKEIVKIFIEFFKEKKVDLVGLHYVISNEEAGATWEKLGFTPTIVNANAKIKDIEKHL